MSLGGFRSELAATSWHGCLGGQQGPYCGWKGQDSLDSEPVAFRMLREGSRAKGRTWALDFRRADFKVLPRSAWKHHIGYNPREKRPGMLAGIQESSPSSRKAQSDIQNTKQRQQECLKSFWFYSSIIMRCKGGGIRRRWSRRRMELLFNLAWMGLGKQQTS